MSRIKSACFKEFRETLQHVLDYLWEDESENYENALDEPEPRRHIFEELQFLARWLEQNPARWPAEATDYSGWANYETWSVHLWLTNEEGSYRYWREQAQERREEARDCEQVEDAIWTIEQAERANLAAQLRNEVEEATPLEEASLFADLLNATLSEVDWHEIATAFLEELGPDADEPETEGDDAAAPRFSMGQVVSTPGALATLTTADIMHALHRHGGGDWGDVGPDDWRENERSIAEGFRLLSVYHAADGTKFWVITEADRASTCVLLPHEY